MSRRRLIWHIGLADAPRPLIPENLAAHTEALHAWGVQVAGTADGARLATHELRRTHRQAGVPPRGRRTLGLDL